MAIVTNDYFIFVYDKKTGLFDTFSNNSWNIKASLFSFLDHCLGVPTEEAKVPEVKVIEVYNVLLRVLLESIWDLKSLIKLYNENPSDEYYNLINRFFFRNQEKFNIIWHLLEEPYIVENIEPEVIKNIHDSFKKYSSVVAEVLEIAMKYNRQHKEEHEKIRIKLRANKEATDYLKQLEANLF